MLLAHKDLNNFLRHQLKSKQTVSFGHLQYQFNVIQNDLQSFLCATMLYRVLCHQIGRFCSGSLMAWHLVEQTTKEEHTCLPWL